MSASYSSRGGCVVNSSSRALACDVVVVVNDPIIYYTIA